VTLPGAGRVWSGLVGTASRLVAIVGRRASAELPAARHAMAVRRRLSGLSRSQMVGIDVLAPLQEITAILEPVRDAFSAAGICYFAVPEPPSSPPRLALLETEIEKAVSALAGSPSSAEWGLTPLDSPWLRGGYPVSIRQPGMVELLRSHSCWLLHRDLHSAAGRAVPDRCGVRLELWRIDNEAGTGRSVLIAPSRNRFVEQIPADESPRGQVSVEGLTLPTFPDLASPTIDDIRFPIDVVYTWVDGTDPDWATEFAAYLSEPAIDLAEYATAPSRYSASDELRYSLRSLEINMPWVRRIYLVTSGQRPSWLRESERLQVISHKEIWGSLPGLPTFNSHAIESRLHHIDGLAEHFVYVNDDIIVTRPTRPQDFFLANGITRFFPSSGKIGIGGPRADEPAPAAAGKNNRRLIRDAFGVVPTRKMWHVPHAHRRSILAEMEQQFPKDFARVAASRFRSIHDISVTSNLGQHYAFVTGRAVPGDLRYRYVSLDEPGVEARLRRAERDGIQILCLNEHGVVEGRVRTAALAVAESYLARRFPCQSVHEV
jgi:Stealth protein CR2, conserved region 2/Stealth protein CR3, conserved region 3/Stealth protein CR1, conserved region 1